MPRSSRARHSLPHYESTRAQFEAFAADGWDNHKMTIYWMLNNHWPSFFGHLFDYYLRPGGCLLRREEGPTPAVGRLRLVRDGRPRHGQDHRRQPVARRTAGFAGPSAGLRPAGQGAPRRRRRPPQRRTRRRGAGAHIAPTRLGFKGFLRPVRVVRPGRQARRRQRLLAVAADWTTSAIRATTGLSNSNSRAGRT